MTVSSLALSQGGNLFKQFTANWDFIGCILGKGDPDGIPETIAQQSADTYGAFDPTILSIARLGHPQVDGVIPIRAQFSQAGHQKPVTGNHDLWIAGLHRKFELMKIQLAGDVGKLESTLHHSQRSVPESVHDAITQRTVIGAYPNHSLEFLAQLHQRSEFGFDAFKLFPILFIGIFPDLELLGIRIIAGIDSNHLHPFGCLHGCLGFEMNVSNQWHVAALVPESLGDVFQIGGMPYRLGRDADQLTACLSEIQSLLHAGLGIQCITGDHALIHDGVVPTELQLSPGILNEDLPSRTTLKLEERGGKFHGSGLL